MRLRAMAARRTPIGVLRSERYRDRAQDLGGDDVTIGAAAGLAALEPVRDHRGQHRLQVLGECGRPAGEEGPRLRRAQQSLAGARRETELQVPALARATDQRLAVIEERI